MTHLVVFLVRFLETLAAMAPSALVGTLLAAVAAAFVPPKRIRRLLGSRDDGRSLNPLLAPVLGTLWGVLLPVCGMGILPVLLVARRAGASRRALASLAVVGGTVNPFTFVYFTGLTAAWKAAAVAGALAAVGVLAGLAAGERRPKPSADELPPAGKLSAAALIGGHFVLRLLPVYAVVTALSAATLATLLPPGHLGHLFAESDVAHVLIGLAAAVPAYAPPSIAALQAGELLWQRADPGLAVGWWLLAGGMSVGTVLFLPRVLGWGGLIRAAVTTAVLAVAAAVVLSPLLRDGPPPDDDTHAFDRHVRPYEHTLTQHGPWTWAGRQLAALSTPELHVTLLGLLLLGATAGLPPAAQSRILTPVPAGTGLRRPLPRGIVLAVLGLCGAGVAVTLLYVRYPDPARLFDELRGPDAEILSLLPTGQWAQLEEPLRQLDDRLERLPLAARLRRVHVPERYREALTQARGELEKLRSAVRSQDVEAARTHALALTRALRAAERAWRHADDAASAP
ncbi:MAG: hypothetical protein ACK4PI_08970 [Tepidisphaerales bacterium]